MVKLIAALALGVSLMFTGFVNAKEKGAAKGGGVSGHVNDATVADGKITLKVQVGKKKDNPGTETVFTVDSNTKMVMADGTEAKDINAFATALKGEKVNVKVVAGEDKKATSVTIVEHKKKA